MKSKKIRNCFLISLPVLPIIATTIGCTTKEKEKEKEKDPKVPTPTPSPNIIKDKNFEFVKNSNETLKIEKYIGNDTNVTIPSEYKGKKITTIGKWAFTYSFYDALYRKNIKTINLPNSIKTIEEYAFTNSSLENITLNEGLEKIGAHAFSNTKIKSIVIPSSVKEIGNSAFDGCFSLSQVTLNEGLEKIGDSAFKDTKITSITIPSSVKEIGNDAFAGFYSRLKKVICKVPRDKITWKWSDLNGTYNWTWTVEYV